MNRRQRNPYAQHRSAAKMLMTASCISLALLGACSSSLPSDPTEAGKQIAEQRCDCTKAEAPYVASCVNTASRTLQTGTEKYDAKGRIAMVKSYESEFERCPWDKPEFYE